MRAPRSLKRLALVLLVVLVARQNTTARAAELPGVRILATGGTIAAAQDADKDTTYQAGQLSVDVLIDAVPQVRTLADVAGEQVCNIGSQDITDAIWLKLARRINELAQDDDVAGIVITHGTDTIEETAYFLHLTAKTDKPIVLTGAMRSPTDLSADGPRNLFNAVAVAADPKAKSRDVLVVFNDEIHGARDVTKLHTTSIAAFASPNSGPLGHIRDGGCKFAERPMREHTTRAPFDLTDHEKLPAVSIIYAHANMQRTLIDAACEAGAKGLVIAGVGNGNMSAAALAALDDAVGRNIAVVRSTRVPAGPIVRNLEIDDDQRGFITAGTLNPQKARVLLMLALTSTTDAGEIQKMFEKY